MPIEKKIIIFDLDGVLINSIKNMEISWKCVSNKYGLNIKFDEYRKNIGLPFDIITKNLKIKNNRGGIKRSYNFYSKKYFNKIKIYPNVKGVLKYLHKRKYITAVITSKDRVRTKKIISLYNLKFKHVLTPNNFIKPKPFPHQIYKIIKQEKIKKKNCYYIGDMNVDAKFAKNAGVNFIFTTYGYEIKKIKSKIKINNFKELKKLF